METYNVKISDIDKRTLNSLSLLIDSEKRNKIEKFISKIDQKSLI